MLRQLMAVSLVSFGMLLSGAAPAVKASTNVPGNADFNIRDYAGKVVYVDFWASWCRPCRQSFPFMNELHEQFGDALAIVAINVDESREDAQGFLEAFNPQFDIIYDPQGELASAFDVPGMPSTYVFDRDGNLILRHIGFKKSQVEMLQKFVSDAVQGSTVLADND